MGWGIKKKLKKIGKEAVRVHTDAISGMTGGLVDIEGMMTKPKRGVDGINDEVAALGRAEYDSWQKTWAPLEAASRDYLTNKAAIGGRIDAAGVGAGMALDRAGEAGTIERQRYGVDTPEQAAFATRQLGMQRAKSVAGAKNVTRTIEAARSEALGDNLVTLGQQTFAQGYGNLAAAGGMEAMRNAADFAEKQRQRQAKIGLVTGIVGAAGGMALGGPAGAAAGYQIGSNAGMAYA